MSQIYLLNIEELIWVMSVIKCKINFWILISSKTLNFLSTACLKMGLSKDGYV
jgi:hypothetical protein